MKRGAKVKATKANKEKYSNANADLIEFLLNSRTKEEVADMLHCSEREARDIVSELACYFVVLADSKHRGYRLAKDPVNIPIAELQEEVNAVKLVKEELLSRVRVLNKRLRPIIAWLSVADDRLNEEEFKNEIKGN